jgi:hypothetical protein
LENIILLTLCADDIGRRTQRLDSSFASLPSVKTNLFDCNPRSEVVSADMDGNAYSYDYDSIGNRLSFNRERTQGTQSVAYAANGRGVQNDPMHGPFYDGKFQMGMRLTMEGIKMMKRYQMVLVVFLLGAICSKGEVSTCVQLNTIHSNLVVAATEHGVSVEDRALALQQAVFLTREHMGSFKEEEARSSVEGRIRGLVSSEISKIRKEMGRRLLYERNSGETYELLNEYVPKLFELLCLTGDRSCNRIFIDDAMRSDSVNHFVMLFECFMGVNAAADDIKYLSIYFLQHPEEHHQRTIINNSFLQMVWNGVSVSDQLHANKNDLMKISTSADVESLILTWDDVEEYAQAVQSSVSKLKLLYEDSRDDFLKQGEMLSKLNTIGDEIHMPFKDKLLNPDWFKLYESDALLVAREWLERRERKGETDSP